MKTNGYNGLNYDSYMSMLNRNSKAINLGSNINNSEKTNPQTNNNQVTQQAKNAAVTDIVEISLLNSNSRNLSNNGYQVDNGYNNTNYGVGNNGSNGYKPLNVDDSNTQAQNNVEPPKSNPPVEPPIQPLINPSAQPVNSQVSFQIHTENFSAKPETKTFNLSINGGSNIKVSYTVFKNMTNDQYAEAISDGLKAAGIEKGKINFNGISGIKEVNGSTSISIMNETGNSDFYVIDNLDDGNRVAGNTRLNGIAFGNWKRPDVYDQAKSLGFYYDSAAAEAAKNAAKSVDMSKIFNTAYAIELGDDGTASFQKDVASQRFSLKVNGVMSVIVTYDVKQTMSARELSDSINKGIKNAGLEGGFTTRLNSNKIEFCNNRYNTDFYILNMFSMGTTLFGSASVPLGLQKSLMIGNIINENAEPFLSDADNAIKDMFLAGDYGDFHGGF
jgi:hypothetical protein